MVHIHFTDYISTEKRSSDHITTKRYELDLNIP